MYPEEDDKGSNADHFKLTHLNKHKINVDHLRFQNHSFNIEKPSVQSKDAFNKSLRNAYVPPTHQNFLL